MLVVLVLASLACSLTDPAPAPHQASLAAATTPSPRPTSEPTPTPTASPTQADGGGHVCAIVADALNVRACAGLDCAVIDWLLHGQTINAAPAGPGWLVLTLADGRAGYIAARYCDFGIGE